MKQYAGLVIIVKERTIFCIYQHFLGMLIIAKRSHYG